MAPKKNSEPVGTEKRKADEEAQPVAKKTADVLRSGVPVLYSRLDPKSVDFGEHKRNQYKGKFVPLQNVAGESLRVTIQTPSLVIPYQQSVYREGGSDDGEIQSREFKVAINYRKDERTIQRGKAFFEKMKELDEHVLDQATRLANDWFGGPRSREVIAQMYRPLVRYNQKSKKEEMVVKIIENSGAYSSKLLDMEGKPMLKLDPETGKPIPKVDPATGEVIVSPETGEPKYQELEYSDLTSGVVGNFVINTDRITFMAGGSFGLKFRLSAVFIFELGGTVKFELLPDDDDEAVLQDLPALTVVRDDEVDDLN